MYDVTIVGGSLAGCSAAILLGRAGFRVALLETHKDPNYYKRLCTATIRSSALPTLQRLGLDKKIADAGGMPCYDAFHGDFGWILDSGASDRQEHGYNLQRAKLDPLVRQAAAETPGVEMVLGAKAFELSRGPHGRVNGVVAKVQGKEQLFSSRLVIGADGRSSTVADLAGLESKESENGRFIFFAHYRNVEIRPTETLRAWFVMPDIFLLASFGDGTTVMAVAPDKRSIAEFDKDREEFLLGAFGNLPDAPDMSNAERVSDVVGTRDYPNMNRRRIVAPGLALIGDAAMVNDPVSGVGCGFAFQSAEWLCDAVTGALRAGDGAAVDKALRGYQRRHRRQLFGHHLTIADLSKRKVLPPVIRMILAGAVSDVKVAERYAGVVTRSRSPFSLFAPTYLARAAIAARKTRAASPDTSVAELAK
ncbi:FAD-dependent oxidoreductase [Streptosporangium sp. NBC_01469]|uniref:FAD-dependent oxidoreductase n=1 Tax=Streptosporangium sp. NBC_01469 TaxID=2903898 RepID=UPI002E2886B5|nr:NAD(P)/FAD-dependent oxidoreductase [Streptosporangium sp. NBC_01469]